MIEYESMEELFRSMEIEPPPEGYDDYDYGWKDAIKTMKSWVCFLNRQDEESTQKKGGSDMAKSLKDMVAELEIERDELQKDCNQITTRLAEIERILRALHNASTVTPEHYEPDSKHSYSYDICPNCGEEVYRYQSFCPHCGKPFLWEIIGVEGE